MAKAEVTALLNPRLAVRKRIGTVAYIIFIAAILLGLAGLAALLLRMLWQGVPWLSLHFLTDYPSRFPEQAGMKSAIFGTIWIMGLTGLFTVPVGVGAAVYLEEYAPKNWFTRIIEVNISNLAGVPSIVYGLLGLAVFVQILALGRTVLAGAMTMSLLVMPIVIIASREAIRAVPSTYREASYGLGATKFQTVKDVVLPHALPGILTGTILAMSRAIGEAAPMIAISALVFLTFIPNRPTGRVLGDAHPDLQLGESTQAGVPRHRGCRHHRPVVRSALHERRGHLHTQPHAEEVRGMTTTTGFTATDTTLSVKNLDMYYGSFRALRDINLDVARNSVTALIGPSGSGKSTLLRCFNRMNDLIPGARVEGEVLFNGEDIYHPSIDPTEIRLRVGMVFQKPNPFPKSIYDNVAFGLRINGFRGNMDEAVERSLRRAALWDEVEGQAQGERPHALRRAAAAPLHRTRRRGPAGRHPHGRTSLRPRPHLDARDRRPYAGAEPGLHHRRRHA